MVQQIIASNAKETSSGENRLVSLNGVTDVANIRSFGSKSVAKSTTYDINVGYADSGLVNAITIYQTGTTNAPTGW